MKYQSDALHWKMQAQLLAQAQILGCSLVQIPIWQEARLRGTIGYGKKQTEIQFRFLQTMRRRTLDHLIEYLILRWWVGRYRPEDNMRFSPGALLEVLRGIFSASSLG